MTWLSGLAAELFPAWHERRLLRRKQAEDDSLTALDRFRRSIAMQDEKSPARDTRETPADNPKTGEEAKRQPERVAPEGERDHRQKDRAVKDGPPKR